MEKLTVQTHIISHPTTVTWTIPGKNLHFLKPPGLAFDFTVNCAVGDNADKIKNGLVKFHCGLVQLEELSYKYSEFEHDGDGRKVYFYIKPEIPNTVSRLEGNLVLEVLNRAGQPWRILNGNWEEDWVDLIEDECDLFGTFFEKYYHKLFDSTSDIFVDRNNNLDTDGNLQLRITFNLMAPHTLKHPDEFILKSKVSENVGIAWASDMECLLNDPTDADFWIMTSDGVEFPVHKLILKSRVPMFQRMFAQENWRENRRKIMDTPTISSGAMRILLHFIYTGKLHNDWRIWMSSVNEVLDGANKYELDGLREYYDRLLITVCTYMDTDDLLATAKFYGLKQAEEDIMRFQEARLETNETSDNFQ